jgi:hypothetical protein
MAKAKKATTTRGHLYSTTASGRKIHDDNGYGTQQALVFGLLRKGEPMSSADLTAAVEKSKKLETRQAVSRVVGFYLTQMKAEGEVSSKAAPKAPKAPKATKKAKAEPVAA